MNVVEDFCWKLSARVLIWNCAEELNQINKKKLNKIKIVNLEC